MHLALCVHALRLAVPRLHTALVRALVRALPQFLGVWPARAKTTNPDDVVDRVVAVDLYGDRLLTEARSASHSPVHTIHTTHAIRVASDPSVPAIQLRWCTETDDQFALAAAFSVNPDGPHLAAVMTRNGVDLLVNVFDSTTGAFERSLVAPFRVSGRYIRICFSSVHLRVVSVWDPLGAVQGPHSVCWQIAGWTRVAADPASKYPQARVETTRSLLFADRWMSAQRVCDAAPRRAPTCELATLHLSGGRVWYTQRIPRQSLQVGLCSGGTYCAFLHLRSDLDRFWVATLTTGDVVDLAEYTLPDDFGAVNQKNTWSFVAERVYGLCSIKEVSVSRDGRHMVVRLNDRMVRVGRTRGSYTTGAVCTRTGVLADAEHVK